MTSGSVEINGSPVWYEKFGNGSEVLLLIPGAIGTGRSDYKPQLEGPHAFDPKKYTIIAIELPGWGRSRPPERIYNKNVYANDANCALKLMDTLGYNSYSVISWSDGARVGLVMAMKSQTKIKCLVMISIFIIPTLRTIGPTLATHDTNSWPNEMRERYEPIYGKQLMQTLWDEFMDFVKTFTDFSLDFWTKEMEAIKCPVLIFHGNMDPLVSFEHPLYMEKNLMAYCMIHRFAKGGHNSHHTNAAEFKRVTEQFFKECDYY